MSMTNESRFLMIEHRLESGEARMERLEKADREFKKVFGNHQIEINQRITDVLKRQDSARAEILGAIQRIQGVTQNTSYPPYSDIDADTISKIQDIERLRQKAKEEIVQSVKKVKNTAKISAPFIVTGGVVAWEILKIVAHLITSR